MGERKIFLSPEPRRTVFLGETLSCGSLQSPAAEGTSLQVSRADDGKTVKLRQRQSVIKSLSLPQAELSLRKCFGCGGL